MKGFLPVDNPKFHSQTGLEAISDEELVEGITPVKCTTKDRILQILQFVFGFGWLRLILFIPSMVLYLFVMLPVITTCWHRKVCDIFVPYGVLVSQIYIRVVGFICGIYKIEIKGKIDEKARAFAFNHQSILDGPLLFSIKAFTIISMSEMLKVPFFGRIIVGADSVFVDRTKTSGTSELVTDAIKRLDKRPVAISPEGKTTRGLYMLKFHTGGFLTENEFQSVAIRYTTYMAFGNSGHTWMCGGLLEWWWRVLSVPFAKVTFTFLPPHTEEELKDKTPPERALISHLEIANSLGVKAVSRTNVEAVKLYKEKLQNKIKKE